MTTIIIIAAVVIIALILISMYNNLVKLRNNRENAFANIDVQLKQRYDLVPQLVATVKGYATHERELLEKVTAARSACMNATTINDRVQADNALASALSGLRVAVEAYPELKANENFLDLHKRIVKAEEEIAFARRYYNGSVRQYNDKCQMFPYNIIANIFGFRAKKMYEIQNVAEREVPNA